MNEVPKNGLLDRLGRGINPAQLLPNLIAGILVGIEETIFAISIGTLVFSGELLPFLPHGVGIALVTGAVLMITISSLSSIKSVIGSLQDSPSVIIAIITASLIGGLSATSLENKFVTIAVTIALISLLTGLFLFALGYFKIGGLLRFIPYPVIGGFLAGTGWLLVRGSFRTMTGYPLSMVGNEHLLQAEILVQWLPGVLFAIILFFGFHRIHSLLFMPVIMISAVIIFYLGLLVTGTSINEAIQNGLLLGNTLGETNWQLLHFNSLGIADWGAILGQAGNIAIILIMSVIGLLINTSALELSLKQDINLDHELRTAGIANILSGLGGGMVGYHTLDASGLSTRLGSRSRLVGILAGLMCLVVLFAGASLLVYFPRFVLGGMLLFLGLDFLYDWLFLGWRRLSTLDYLVVLLILAVIATTSFLAGVGVGLGVMIIIFVVNYSRVDIVRHALSGRDKTSNVERLDQQEQILKQLGGRIYILELQGYIFFGTANALLDRIRTRLSDVNQSPVRYIILDFRHTTGLDSSAVFSFIKGKQILDEQGVELVFSDVKDDFYTQLETGGLFETGTKVHRTPDLDRGLEWCEDKILREYGLSDISLPGTLRERMESAGFSTKIARNLIQYLDRVDLEPGDYLAHQGDKADALFFIESGKLSIYLEIEQNEQVRLQTLGLRTMVGELGLYLDANRTASIIAEEPSIVYSLSRSTLDHLKMKDPEIAAAIHEFVARLLADRLADTTRLLGTLSD